MPNANESSAISTASQVDDLVITRVFNAPQALVFAAWTEPQHLAHWSGPTGFTTPHSSMDLRPGGHYRACLRSPDGVDHWLQGTYKEIDPPKRLVMTHAWEDEQGKPGPATLITVRLTQEGPGRPRMVFRQSGFTSVASRDGHDGGWSGSFDKLAAHVEGAQP